MATFYQRFQESARKFPSNVALEIQRAQTVERVTFAELSHMSESVGKWLSGRVAPDARVKEALSRQRSYKGMGTPRPMEP